jgi:hypothetical protein
VDEFARHRGGGIVTKSIAKMGSAFGRVLTSGFSCPFTAEDSEHNEHRTGRQRTGISVLKIRCHS